MFAAYWGLLGFGILEKHCQSLSSPQAITLPFFHVEHTSDTAKMIWKVSNIITWLREPWPRSWGGAGGVLLRPAGEKMGLKKKQTDPAGQQMITQLVCAPGYLLLYPLEHLLGLQNVEDASLSLDFILMGDLVYLNTT